MKKLSTSIMLMAVLALAISFTGCKSKVKDADIRTAIETALKADPMAANTTVSVEKGIATISGECKDNACKTHCAEIVKSIKGVKDVVNNCTTLPVVVNSPDEVLTKALTDALKDNPGVTGSVEMGKFVLSGTITKDKWMALRDVLDKLTPKGYKLDGLTIK